MPKTEHQKAIDRCDDLWSEFIRKRAMAKTHGCQRCLGYKHDYHELQAAHCFGRGQTVRWEINAGAGLCGGCHLYIDNHETHKFEFFRELINDSAECQRLYVLSNMTSKQSPVDLKMVEITLKALIKELDSCYVTT